MKANCDLEYLHVIKLQPSHAVSYYFYKNQSEKRYTEFKKYPRKCNAILSLKAKQNLRNCFQWMQIISNLKEVYSKQENKTFRFKLSFITLTLSDIQIHSDDYIKKHLLEPFLKWMQRSWSANSYIWKAEVQNNGNIHFHITTNKFIHWKSIRAKWNRLLSAHGYCKVYQDGTNDKGNAATDIKAVKNQKDITGYIVGYTAKKDLFKKIKSPGKAKPTYINSESCEITNHYYLKENFRQIECTDGTIREYKRFIHGRIWSASTNLNQSAEIITELNGYHDATNSIINNDNLTTTKSFDFHKIHLYNKKIFPFMPITIRQNFKERIRQLIEDDVKQTIIEIESIY